MRSRTSRRSCWGWRSARAWSSFCAFVLLVLCLPHPLPALTSSESAQIKSMLEEAQALRLISIELRQRAGEQKRLSVELEQKLTQAEQRAQQLDARLRLWQEHSAELSDSLETLSSELAASRSSLEALRSDLAALSQGYSGYRLAAEARILELQSSARTWRVVAIAGIPAALAVGLLAGLLVK